MIYMVQRRDDPEGIVKIGTTEHFKARMYALTREHGPLKVLARFPGGRKAESMVHAALRKRRVRGEWFEWSRNLTDVVDFLLT